MDKYFSQLGISGPFFTFILCLLIAVELIKAGKVLWDFIAPKILGIQTTVSKEKKYRKQIEDNNIKLNEYLDTQSDMNKEVSKSLEAISNKLELLSDDVIDLKIEEMRQKILEFASAVNAGRVYTKEQYNFIRKLYHTYEALIVRTGKTNDEVEISMEIINSYYAYSVKHHCFVEDRLNDARIQSMLQTLDDEDKAKNKSILEDDPKDKPKRGSNRKPKQSQARQSNRGLNIRDLEDLDEEDE